MQASGGIPAPISTHTTRQIFRWSKIPNLKSAPILDPSAMMEFKKSPQAPSSETKTPVVKLKARATPLSVSRPPTRPSRIPVPGLFSDSPKAH